MRDTDLPVHVQSPQYRERNQRSHAVGRNDHGLLPGMRLVQNAREPLVCGASEVRFAQIFFRIVDQEI
jgi:hypothetical protein